MGNFVSFLSGCGFMFIIVIFISLNVDNGYEFYKKCIETSEVLCKDYGGPDSFDLNNNYTCKDGTTIYKEVK